MKSGNPVVVIKTFITAVILMSLLLSFFYYFFWVQHGMIDQLNVEYVKGYFFREALSMEYYQRYGGHPVMGRGRSVVEAFRLMSEDSLSLFVGKGSGGGSESALLNRSGNYYQFVGPLAGITRTAISKIIFEYGLIGLSLFFLFFFRLYGIIKKQTNGIDRDLTLLLFVVILMLSFYSPWMSSYVSAIILSLYLSLSTRKVNL